MRERFVFFRKLGVWSICPPRNWYGDYGRWLGLTRLPCQNVKEMMFKARSSCKTSDKMYTKICFEDFCAIVPIFTPCDWFSTREYAAWCVSLIYHMERVIKPKRTQKFMIIFHYMDQWLFINTGQWHVCLFVKDVDQLKLCLNDHEWCVLCFSLLLTLKERHHRFAV